MESLADVRDTQTYAVIGAAMEVHRVLGCGFLEHVYQDALAYEFESRNVPFVREVPLQISFKGHLLEPCYRIDFVCFDRVLVELKAMAQIGLVEHAQMINYLKIVQVNRPDGTSRLDAARGLILNFGNLSLEWKRVVLSEAVARQGRTNDWREHIDQ